MFTTFVVAMGAFLGMTVQRCTGLGFAMTAVPIFTSVLGAYEGVLLANALSIPVTLSVLAATWRNCEPMRAAALVTTSALALLPGVALAKTVPQWALQLVGGGVILLSLALMRMRPIAAAPSSRSGLAAVGLSSGLLNATVAMGGPPIAIYANATGWSMERYVPTMQCTFLSMNLTALWLKGVPSVSASALVSCVAAIAFGALAGGYLSRNLRREILVRLAMIIATAGACSLIGKVAWDVVF